MRTVRPSDRSWSLREGLAFHCRKKVQLLLRICSVFHEEAIPAQLLDLLLVCREGLGHAVSFVKKESPQALFSGLGLRRYPKPNH